MTSPTPELIPNISQVTVTPLLAVSQCQLLLEADVWTIIIAISPWPLCSAMGDTLISTAEAVQFHYLFIHLS